MRGSRVVNSPLPAPASRYGMGLRAIPSRCATRSKADWLFLVMYKNIINEKYLNYKITNCILRDSLQQSIAPTQQAHSMRPAGMFVSSCCRRVKRAACSEGSRYVFWEREPCFIQGYAAEQRARLNVAMQLTFDSPSMHATVGACRRGYCSR